MFNSKKIKKIICLMILLLLLLSINSLAVVSPTEEFFVNDYASVLTEETKNYIVQTNIELQEKTGTQIVVVTVSSLEGKSIEEYATEVFRKFKIGDSEKNNGVLLICSTGERLFRIEVGYGLEGTLTDGRTGIIQDKYIIPYLKNNNYDQGIKNGFSAVVEEISNEYGIVINNQKTYEKIVPRLLKPTTFEIIIFILSILILGVRFFIKERKKKILFSIIFAGVYILINYITKSLFMIMVFPIILIPVFYLGENFEDGGNRWYRGSSGSKFSGRGGSSGGGGSTRSF